MKRAARVILMVMAAIALGMGLLVLAARRGLLSPSEAILRARYAIPGSRFMLIDGQSVHFADEGHGFPVVLVHGSFGSLRMWDEWARELGARYRVIRFDRPPMGLSGPAADGRYGPGREAELIGELTARLGVHRFFLGATSSAGEAAAAFAAANPGQIEGVILSNIAAGPITPRPAHYPWYFQGALWLDPYLGGWRPTLFWRGVLTTNYADPGKVTPSLVREWTDLNNRAQFFRRRPPAPGYVAFAYTPLDLAAIHAPALVLWSDRDPEVPLAVDGRLTLSRLGSPDKRMVVIHDCGHMMALECGADSAKAALSFLDRVSAMTSPQANHQTQPN